MEEGEGRMQWEDKGVREEGGGRRGRGGKGRKEKRRDGWKKKKNTINM